MQAGRAGGFRHNWGVIEMGSGRDAESQRARGGGIVGREEVKLVLSFPYVSPSPCYLLPAIASEGPDDALLAQRGRGSRL